jgi:aryl-alcohol dehydrogenase-like predicted oxidoreductase
VALAWLLGKHAVTSVIVGAAKLGQLEDNLGAANLTLSASELHALDAATPLSPVYPNWYIDGFGDQQQAQALAGTASG